MTSVWLLLNQFLWLPWITLILHEKHRECYKCSTNLTIRIPILKTERRLIVGLDCNRDGYFEKNSWPFTSFARSELSANAVDCIDCPRQNWVITIFGIDLNFSSRSIGSRSFIIWISDQYSGWSVLFCLFLNLLAVSLLALIEIRASDLNLNTECFVL